MATWLKQAAALPGWVLADRPEDLRRSRRLSLRADCG